MSDARTTQRYTPGYESSALAEIARKIKREQEHKEQKDAANDEVKRATISTISSHELPNIIAGENANKSATSREREHGNETYYKNDAAGKRGKKRSNNIEARWMDEECKSNYDEGNKDTVWDSFCLAFETSCQSTSSALQTNRHIMFQNASRAIGEAIAISKRNKSLESVKENAIEGELNMQKANGFTEFRSVEHAARISLKAAMLLRQCLNFSLGLLFCGGGLEEHNQSQRNGLLTPACLPPIDELVHVDADDGDTCYCRKELITFFNTIAEVSVSEGKRLSQTDLIDDGFRSSLKSRGLRDVLQSIIILNNKSESPAFGNAKVDTCSNTRTKRQKPYKKDVICTSVADVLHDITTFGMCS